MSTATMTPAWLNLTAVIDTDMQAELTAAAAEAKALEEAVAAVARRAFRVNARYTVAVNDVPSDVFEMIDEHTPHRELSNALASLIGQLVTAFGEDAWSNCGIRPAWLRDEVLALGQTPFWLERYLDSDDASEEVAR